MAHPFSSPERACLKIIGLKVVGLPVVRSQSGSSGFEKTV
jgi:hypothetical protein